MTAVSAVPELVSVTHRYRWMLACRLLLTTWLVALHVIPNDNRLPANATYLAVVWLATAGVMALVTRTGRGFAGTAFTVSLLGDGVVLGYAWHTTGGLSGDVGYLIVLHGIGSTLLASFRTGAKIALWH